MVGEAELPLTSRHFSEEREIAQLRRLWTRIELEITRVLEAVTALKESPDYELHRLTTQTPAFFDEMEGTGVRARIALLQGMGMTSVLGL
jgi:hypothetical protein